MFPVRLKRRKPKPVITMPMRTIWREPSRSIRYPINGPIMLPSSWAMENAPVNWARLQPNCNSRALIHTPTPLQTGPLDRQLTNKAALTIIHP